MWFPKSRIQMCKVKILVGAIFTGAFMRGHSCPREILHGLQIDVQINGVIRILRIGFF